MNLHRHLLGGTWLAAALTSLALALALVVWTVLDARREIRADRALVAATVEAVQAARTGTQAAPSTGPSLRRPDMRHVRISLSAHEEPSADLTWLGRLVDAGSQWIALPPELTAAGAGPIALRIDGDAHAEVVENLWLASLAFLSLFLLGALLVAMQSRLLLRAMRPVGAILDTLKAFECGDLGRRMPTAELAELDAIATGFNRLADTLEDTVASERRLSERLITTRADERRSLARDLHDDLGQALTGISVQLAVHRQQLGAGSATQALDAAEAQIERLRSSMRAMLSSLRDGEALDEAARGDIPGLLRAWQRAHPGVTVDVAPGTIDAIESLTLPGYRVVYRALQEGLSNGWRHARARRFLVVARSAHDAFRLTMENDRSGTPPQREEAPGFGLQGMRERAAAIGAQVSAGPIDQGGWRTELVIPT